MPAMVYTKLLSPAAWPGPKRSIKFQIPTRTEMRTEYAIQMVSPVATTMDPDSSLRVSKNEQGKKNKTVERQTACTYAMTKCNEQIGRAKQSFFLSWTQARKDIKADRLQVNGQIISSRTFRSSKGQPIQSQNSSSVDKKRIQVGVKTTWGLQIPV